MGSFRFGKKVPKVLEQPAVLHVFSIIKAGISAIPLFGTPIASLIGDYIPTATQRNIEKSIEYLKKEFANLGYRIDIESINRDEFSEMFKRCYQIISQTHQDMKLQAAARLLSNIFLKRRSDKLNFTELDHFTRCLDNLSIGAIEVLGKVVRVFLNGKSKRQVRYQIWTWHLWLI
ncbi:MAG: hypothetical protein R3B51_13465 [Thermodesulfobacteriota bacterium]